MKREDITALGIEDKDVLDKIMALHGADIEKHKNATTAKDTELATANETIKQLQDTVKKFDGVDVTKLNQQITDLQTKYNTDTAQIKLDAALNLALVQAKARNPKAARALLDTSKIKMKEDGTLDGLDLEGLKKSDPYLFEIESKEDEGPGHQGGDGGDGATSNYDKMNDAEYYAATVKKG